MTLDTKALAQEISQAKQNGAIITEPPTTRDSAFDMAEGYAVEAGLVALRKQAGHTVVGRKIGFANRTTLANFGLDSVPWASMYDDTVLYAQDNSIALSTAKMVAPKLEVEIVMKLKSPLTSGKTDAVAVLSAVEWIALGYEVVDNPYPNWQTKAPDFVAAFGYHAALLVGTPKSLDGVDLTVLAEQLGNCKLRLLKNGETTVEGGGENVLGNPAWSLGDLAEGLTRQSGTTTLAAGEIITTGTLIIPPLVTAGEEYRAELEGLDLPPLVVRFTA